MALDTAKRRPGKQQSTIGSGSFPKASDNTMTQHRLWRFSTVLALALAAVVALAVLVPSIQSSSVLGSRSDTLQAVKGDAFANAGRRGMETEAAAQSQVNILASYPHDPKAFTQGLVVARFGDSKFFIESTGLFGESSLRKVDITTGEVQTKYALGDKLFGEGVTIGKGGELVMLTWKNELGLVFSLANDHADFVLKRQFTYTTVSGEGWGIDNDGRHLVVSDGSSTIMFWDPVTMKEVRRITVTLRGQQIKNINELEFAKGFIYANIWYQQVIVKIDPRDGAIVAVFNCSSIVQQSTTASSDSNAVLNGIAYDGDEDVFYITGKLWDTVFKVQLLD